MKVREVIFSNFQLKLWSLLIGALIYLGIRSLIQEEIMLEIPIQVRQAKGQDLFHLDQKTRSARVQLKGPRTQLENLDRGSLSLVINLDSELPGGGSAGNHVVPLRQDHLSQVPRQIVAEFRDKNVEVVLTQMKTVRVPVKAVMEFDTPFEYSLRYSRPQLVTVRGPQDVVESLEFIHTLPARDKIEYTALTQVEADLVREINGVPISVSPSRVILHLNVKEKLDEHTLPGIYVGVLTNPGDRRQITLEHKTVDLVITGPPRLSDGTLLKELDPNTVMVFVDARNLPETDPADPPSRKVFVKSKYGDELKIVPRLHSRIKMTIKAP